MNEIHPVLKKLQYKEKGQPVLILNPPNTYKEVMVTFQGRVDSKTQEEQYEFIQIFGASNQKIREAAEEAMGHLKEDGLLWLCYPKKSSKTYKGSDCSRDTVGPIIADYDFEPVRQIAVDEDWSALRFRKVDKIKSMVRDFAYTEKGKARTENTNT